MWLEAFRPNQAVLIDGFTGAVATRAEIESRGERLAEELGTRGLVFLLAGSTLDSAATFHALLSAGLPVALLDAAAQPQATAALAERYRPAAVLLGERPQQAHADGAPARPGRPGQPEQPVHPDLAVLLTTSGSTGSPKFVRLSRGNIAANARQIASSLGLSRRDRGVTALPFHYSFGMSVLTSHASVGSAVVVTAASVLEPSLWQQLAQHEVTLFPGVPQTYQMLHRLRFGSRQLAAIPSLRGLLQAGGRLDPELVAEFAALMTSRDGAFYVMYGQTEASPRIACLPPERLPEKLGSAGVALPGVALEARAPSGSALPAGAVGEIFCTGPNVMMGYAESPSDLALGDLQGDTLATGDLGLLDDEGFLFLSGRVKRIAKVAGLRISLDEVEGMVAADLQAVAVEAPEGTITLATQSAAGDGEHTRAARTLAKALRLPPRSIRVLHVAAIPLLPSGKVDYPALQALAGQR